MQKEPDNKQQFINTHSLCVVLRLRQAGVEFPSNSGGFESKQVMHDRHHLMQSILITLGHTGYLFLILVCPFCFSSITSLGDESCTHLYVSRLPKVHIRCNIYVCVQDLCLTLFIQIGRCCTFVLRAYNCQGVTPCSQHSCVQTDLCISQQRHSTSLKSRLHDTQSDAFGCGGTGS